MSGKPRPRWKGGELKELFRLRDELRLGWDEIAARFPGRSGNSCRQAWYSRRDAAGAASRKAKSATPAAAAGKPPIAAPPAVAAALAGPIRRPRYFSELDAEIVARIERQGLTAGFCGDPLPGRSALDRKRTGLK